MRTCTCPVGTYMTSIGTQSCPSSFGQIQKVIFQRSGGLSSAGLGSSTTVLTYATWTALAAATDASKIVVTPTVSGFTTELGAAREFGTGNEVPNGVPIIFGTGPTKVTFKLYEPLSSLVRNLKALECETLQASFVNELGQVAADETSSAAVTGFDIQSFHVSDRMLGGFDSPDYVEVSFSMPANWSKYFTIYTLSSGSMLDITG